ncbi:hypothetical protein AKJ16_DCAP24843 [Drosera capensis]
MVALQTSLALLHKGDPTVGLCLSFQSYPDRRCEIQGDTMGTSNPALILDDASQKEKTIAVIGNMT